MVREPVVAGQFYPAERESLRRAIKRYLGEEKERKRAKGIVVPHAGYVYSAAVAASVYSKIEIPANVLLIGPNHTGYGPPFSLMAEGRWRTPLGDTEISPLAKEILKESKYLKEDKIAHQYEHSLEVQIPFLQYLLPSVKIIPLVLGFPLDSQLVSSLGEEIGSKIASLKEEVLIIASSDMTHYEPDKIAREKDNYAISAIISLDEKELIKRVKEKNISMCGVLPVGVMISATKKLGAKSSSLVAYQTSGDTSGDYSQVVGYAGLIIE